MDRNAVDAILRILEGIAEGCIWAGPPAPEPTPRPEGLDTGQELRPGKEAGGRRTPRHEGGGGRRNHKRLPHRRAPSLLRRHRLRLLVAWTSRDQHDPGLVQQTKAAQPSQAGGTLVEGLGRVNKNFVRSDPNGHGPSLEPFRLRDLCRWLTCSAPIHSGTKAWDARPHSR